MEQTTKAKSPKRFTEFNFFSITVCTLSFLREMRKTEENKNFQFSNSTFLKFICKSSLTISDCILTSIVMLENIRKTKFEEILERTCKIKM